MEHAGTFVTSHTIFAERENPHRTSSWPPEIH
jgi:hypothetical protein